MFASEISSVKTRYKVEFFTTHKKITQKISKTMGLLRRFQPILLISTLITIYKTDQLDYADVIFDQAYNFSFHEKTRISPI